MSVTEVNNSEPSTHRESNASVVNVEADLVDAEDVARQTRLEEQRVGG